MRLKIFVSMVQFHFQTRAGPSGPRPFEFEFAADCKAIRNPPTWVKSAPSSLFSLKVRTIFFHDINMGSIPIKDNRIKDPAKGGVLHSNQAAQLYLSQRA